MCTIMLVNLVYFPVCSPPDVCLCTGDQVSFGSLNQLYMILYLPFPCGRDGVGAGVILACHVVSCICILYLYPGENRRMQYIRLSIAPVLLSRTLPMLTSVSLDANFNKLTTNHSTPCQIPRPFYCYRRRLLRATASLSPVNGMSAIRQSLLTTIP